MRGKIGPLVIIIPLTVILGGATIYTILNSIYLTATAPHPQITWQKFSVGSCVPETQLWWKSGEHWIVTATFNLTNTGQSDASVNIDFKSDGSTVDTVSFYAIAGQTQTLTHQFQAEGCVTHTYDAEISGSSRT